MKLDKELAKKILESERFRNKVMVDLNKNYTLSQEYLGWVDIVNIAKGYLQALEEQKNNQVPDPN